MSLENKLQRFKLQRFPDSPGVISIDVTNTLTQSNLGEKGLILAYNSRVQSNILGILRQEIKQLVTLHEQSRVPLLARSQFLLSSTVQDYLPREWCRSHWIGSSYIN